MLKAVEELVPDLLPFITPFTVSHPPFSGETKFCSLSLGRLLFCLTIHHLILQLRSKFCGRWDTGGQYGDVLQDLHTVELVAEVLGLQLNRGKLEVICPDPTTRISLLPSTPGLHVTSPNHAALLGSLLGDMDSISNTI